MAQKQKEKLVFSAEHHAMKCLKIINEKGLAEALEYCSDQGINPPQCSLTAQSENAEKLRATAKRMLSEIKWWERRLERKSNQEFEHRMICTGNVTNRVSDGTLKNHLSKKRR